MMGSRCLGSCCPRFALNGKSKIVSWYVPYLPPAPLTPGTQQAGRWHTRSLTLPRSYWFQPQRGHPLWRWRPLAYHCGLSLGSLWFCQTARRACRERNVPVMLGIRLSRCEERTISVKEKSVGEWSVPPYDLLLFLPHCTFCEATQFLSVLSMLYENWVCDL